MRKTLLLPALLLIAAISACERAGSQAEADRTAATASADRPCAEHGVLEAICTKCNPKLAPIFQSKGDWCAEHALPESVCPLCHPERGGRPLMDVAAGDTGDLPPPHGMRVKLASPALADEAGIRVVASRAGGDESVVLATASIVADNARSALVNVRVAGVIRAYKVEVGALVREGQPLAEIESAEMADAQARLQSAAAREEATQAARQREQRLHERGISSEKDAQAAEQAHREAQAELAAAAAALALIGATDGVSGRYDLLAPISGTLTRRNFTVGALVHGEDPIFEIMDTGVLWVEIDVPEALIHRVAPGQRVLVEVDGIGERTFETAVRSVSPAVDPSTRTVRARAPLDNAEGALRANTYARARIYTPSGGAAALVPRAAVQDAKGTSIVFVPVGAGEYETRHVALAPSDTPLLAVTAGLRPGELVVAEGSFFLKTETLKESIGAGCCDVGEAR